MPLNLINTCPPLSKALVGESGNACVHPYLVNTEGMCCFWPAAVHYDTASHCSHHLSAHVDKGSERTDLAADQEAQRDGGIQVGSADVSQALRQRGNGQAEGQRHFYLLVGVGVIAVPYCGREADEDEDDRPQTLCQDRPPKSPRFDFRHDRSVES